MTAGDRTPRWKRWLKVVAINVLGLLACLLLIELLLILALASPQALAAVPDALLQPLRRYYVVTDRRIVQFLPECAEYDEELLYRLRPGECTFENREFAVRLSINAQGLRDDATSLERPEIIAVGDSMTMGWGVGQHESFPELLEGMLRRRVLNAGQSSYGTVRELLMLQRLDQSNLQVLILQYARNDWEENLSFMEKGGRFESSSERVYRDTVERHAQTHAYTFGKHTWHVLGLRRYGAALWRRTFARSRQPASRSWPTLARQVEAFSFALKYAPLPPGDYPVLLLDLNGNGHNDPKFGNAVLDWLRRTGDPLAGRVMFVDVSTVLTDAHYFELDDHLRPAGHREVARLLGDAVRQVVPEAAR